MAFKLKSGNSGPFKMMGSSPAKGLAEQSQVVDGQVTDERGNVKPKEEQVEAGLQQDNEFSNKDRKEKMAEKGQTETKEETLNEEAGEMSGEEKAAAEKQDKKDKDMDTMNSSIDSTLGN